MILAIHNGKDKKVSWNTKWIDYCENNNIPYIGVDCYSPDIIKTLKEKQVTHLMWAFSLELPKDLIVAQSVLNAADTMGIKTCPNFNNRWHFEDKVAQKYLLESIQAPVVDSWAFFDKDKALAFINKTELPIVAKLRRGAGSFNVVLLKTKKAARKYVNQMFDRGGVSPRQSIRSLGKDKLAKVSNHQKTNLNIKDLYDKLVIHLKRKSLYPNELGYVYFQEFLKDNKNDLRIAIVGGRAWGFYRGVRPNDFRASGSGIIDYDTPLPLDVVEESFRVTKRLKTQSLCFDYVKKNDGGYRIVEVCYGYVGSAIFNCNGYWDENLTFHEGHYYPEELILEDFIIS